MVNKKLLDLVKRYIGQPLTTNESRKELGDLTIIVPTYMRPDYAIRTMAYWSRRHACVSVVDGSPEALPDDLLQVFATSETVSYFHAPLSLPERIRIAIDKAQTQYVMCMADDDFYLSSGLLAAMRMLHASRGAIACMGQSVGLDVDTSCTPYFFSYGGSLRNYSVEGSAASERMRQGIKNYRSAAFYAMYRRDSFEKIWRDIQRSSCPEQIEYEHAMRAFLEGPLLTSSEIYWVRSFECDPVTSPIDGGRSTDFSSWFTSPAYNKERHDFINRMACSVCGEMNWGETESRALVFDLCQYIVGGSHVGLTSPPTTVIRELIRLKMLIGSGRAAGVINYLRNSDLGIRFRSRFLHFSREKLEANSRNFPSDCGEAAEVLSFVGQFLSVVLATHV